MAGALATLALVGTTAVASAQSPAAATLEVSGAWARTSPMMELAGAAFMTIHNTGTTDDALVGAASPASNVVELHETKDDGTGVMTMMPVEAIPVPAGGMAELKPGSFHIMLIELVAPLEAGAIVPLTLTFESGATLEVEAPVGDGPPSTGPIAIEGAWARTSPMMEMAGAAYMVIKNTGAADDALIGVTSPAANVVETHETKDDGTGQMAMMPVESIAVPAGGMAELKPGSFHIMLIDLVAPLAVGDMVPLTLTFESGTVVEVMAEVRDGAPMPMGSEAPMHMGSPAASEQPM
jgi:copper(I)-binding protein